MTVVQKIVFSFLISVLLCAGIIVLAISESIFSMPPTVQIIFVISLLLSVFLTVFLLFNLRQDPVTIIQNRLKRLQVSLIEQFYEQKADMDWNRWIRELRQQREEVRYILKRGVKIQDKKNQTKSDIDALIDKSWNELFAMIGGRREIGIDEEKLKAIFTRVLAELGATIPMSQSLPETPLVEKVQEPAQEELQKTDDLIELLDELEVVEEPETIPETMLEEPEDAELIEEVEEPEEITDEIAMEEKPAAETLKGPEVDLAEIASLIEFGKISDEEENDEELTLQNDLEIASPFDTMFTNGKEADESDIEELVMLPDDDDGPEISLQTSVPIEVKEDTPGENSENEKSEGIQVFPSVEGLSVLYKPFHAAAQSSPQTLQALAEDDDSSVPEEITGDITDDVIEERQGVHYIKKTTLDTKAQNLNKDFKNLVDSVI